RTSAIYRNVDSLAINRNSEILYDYKPVRKVWNEADNMPVIFSRAAELYLIKAESLYRTDAPIAECYKPIEQIRNRAGAKVEIPATRQELEEAIFREWMIEMSFENWHEWFAMIRFAGYENPDFSRLLAMNADMKDAYDTECEASDAQGQKYYQRIIDRRIDAIPSGEISANQLCKQNPGYN
ncbi:MAG: RagB/SusD family nutrient uptake outer membrane protein, partial [Muribaculaceae bacterium]|nr:RagB/SusD family nutrient uptake outer membrane protein [Muribaculaceae bacterium]